MLTTWRDRVGELSDWVDWRYLPDRFGHLGLKSFWNHLQQHEIKRERVVDLFLKSFWSGWLDAMFQSDPVLNAYRRGEHEATLKEFRELDRKIIQQGAGRIIAILDPLQSNRDGGEPGVALLMKEAHKKTKHLTLRQLFDHLPALLLQLKPCMLMSPLSVSQFLPAGMQFDLIVFDEASQILPEDAVGAIYRGKQLVVSGDNQQLPPTTFFQQNADDGNEEEEVPLFESILDACLGAGVPQRMLRWHYRSQHEHLIAFSNECFYDGRLVTFPSASLQDSAFGVQLHHVADGIYDRSGRRDNPREAQVVAQLALDHFRNTPDKTLGIIAFSYAQMDAIEDEIERRLRDQPDLERFVHGDRLEGFFVKNLETVQGDERDVILLSVGYGRDAQGRIELNFGPLNREGGERRLNVAVTRARQRLIVVSSIRARDLDLAGSKARGLSHLRLYLDFAERGTLALEPDAQAPAPFTGLHDDVMAELKKLGFNSAAMIGCGSCRLDIGVRDPKQSDRFVLGIEFDGADHARAQTARDRDRLRPEVFARLGWKLHRIGAPDWIAQRRRIGASARSPFLFPLQSPIMMERFRRTCPLFPERTQRMHAKDVSKLALKSAHDTMLTYLGDLSDQDITVRPVPAANNIAWQLAHLATAETYLLGDQIPGAVYPEIPAAIVALGNERTGKADPLGGYLPKAQYIECLNKLRAATIAAVDKLADADLDKPVTNSMAKFAPTLAALLILTANHTLMHGGQFTVVRRALGKPVVM